MVQHVLSVDDITPHLDLLLGMMSEREVKFYPHTVLNGTLIATWFCDGESSTRTKVSFQTAARRAGGDFIDISLENSTKKGESFEDTIEVLSHYFDALVIRRGTPFPRDFSCRVPVINAGDGENEHPTQALLDLFTIRNHFPKGMKYKICLVGDLGKSRVARSLVKILTHHGDAEIYFNSNTIIPEDVRAKGLDLSIWEFEKLLPSLDVLYMTRPQQERGTDFTPHRILGSSIRLEKLKSNALIMHPLPRVNEIQKHVDNDSRAVYFREQVPNGLIVRRTLLKWLLT